MSDAPHEQVPSAPEETDAQVIQLYPEALPSERIQSLSDTDCVALLVDYGLHPSVKPDAMYETLYRLIYTNQDEIWRDRISSLINADSDQVYAEHADDPVLQELVQSLRTSRSKPGEQDKHEARKVLLSLVELRCIELRDEADSNWTAFLSKLPSL